MGINLDVVCGVCGKLISSNEVEKFECVPWKHKDCKEPKGYDDI